MKKNILVIMVSVVVPGSGLARGEQTVLKDVSLSETVVQPTGKTQEKTQESKTVDSALEIQASPRVPLLPGNLVPNSPATMPPVDSYKKLDKEASHPLLEKQNVPLIIQPETLSDRATPDNALSDPLQKTGKKGEESLMLEPLLSAQKKAYRKGDIPCMISTLEEALMSAYYLNVDLENQRTTLKLVVEDMSRSLAEWRPSLLFKANQRMNVSRAAEVLTAPIFPQIGTNLPARDKGRYNDGNLEIEARQNLYSGGGTMARTDRAQEQFRAGLFQLVAQEQAVFVKVIEAYVDVIVAEETLTMASKSEYYLTEILEQTRMRYEIGDDQTIADVEAAKAKLSSAVVQVISAKAQIKAKRADLFMLINRPLSAKLIMPDFYKDIPKTLPELNQCSLKYYPPLIMTIHEERASRFGVADVTSQFLPTIDVTGGIGTEQVWRQNRQSPAFLRNVTKKFQRSANVYFSLTFPIYEKGITHSKYRSAEQGVKQARLKIEQQRRLIIDLCATHFANFEAAKDNVAATKIALSSNRIALEAARTELGLGLKKFLDMLQIEENWVQSYREHIHAMADLVKSSYRVLEMTGKLTAKCLSLRVDLQDPCVYYEKYVDSLWSLGEDEERKNPFAPCNKKEK